MFFKARLLKYNSWEFTVKLFLGLATRVATLRTFALPGRTPAR